MLWKCNFFSKSVKRELTFMLLQMLYLAVGVVALVGAVLAHFGPVAIYRTFGRDMRWVLETFFLPLFFRPYFRMITGIFYLLCIQDSRSCNYCKYRNCSILQVFLLDLRMLSEIARDPLLYSSGVLVCSIRTDWRTIQQ